MTKTSSNHSDPVPDWIGVLVRAAPPPTTEQVEKFRAIFARSRRERETESQRDFHPVDVRQRKPETPAA